MNKVEVFIRPEDIDKLISIINEVPQFEEALVTTLELTDEQLAQVESEVGGVRPTRPVKTEE